MGVCLPKPLEQTNQTLGGRLLIQHDRQCLHTIHEHPPQFMRKELPDHLEDGSSLAGTADLRILVQASDPLDRIFLFGYHRTTGTSGPLPTGEISLCVLDNQQ